jgi:hypothetical protein
MSFFYAPSLSSKYNPLTYPHISHKFLFFSSAAQQSPFKFGPTTLQLMLFHAYIVKNSLVTYL